MLGLSLVASEQALDTDELSLWYECELANAQFAGVYAFGYNGVLLARGGVGYMLGLDTPASIGPGTGLGFRPFWSHVVSHIDFVLCLRGAETVMSQRRKLLLHDIEKSCGVREVAAGKRDGRPLASTGSWDERTLRGESWHIPLARRENVECDHLDCTMSNHSQKNNYESTYYTTDDNQ